MLYKHYFSILFEIKLLSSFLELLKSSHCSSHFSAGSFIVFPVPFRSSLHLLHSLVNLMLFSFAFGFPLILLCLLWLLRWHHSPQGLNPPLSTQQSLSITYTQTRLLGSKSHRKSQWQRREILSEKPDHIYFCTYRLQQPFSFVGQTECPGKPVIPGWPKDTGLFKGSAQEGWGNGQRPNVVLCSSEIPAVSASCSRTGLCGCQAAGPHTASMAQHPHSPVLS